MNIAALLIVLRLVFSRTTWVAIANNVFSLFIFPVDGFGWAGVVVLLVLSDALSRRKRFAWWVSLVVFGLMWLVAAAFFIIVVTEVFIGWPTDTLNDVDLAGYLGGIVDSSSRLCCAHGSRQSRTGGRCTRWRSVGYRIYWVAIGVPDRWCWTATEPPGAHHYSHPSR